MEYREHRGVKLSEIGIGSYALSGIYGKIDPQSFRRMIERAYELGVNFFDTAEAYGSAERILGEAVRPFRNEIVLSTKVGIKKGARPDLSAEYIQSACQESLQNLQTDYIDLYHIHYDEPDREVEEVLGALDELVREGLIRHYGLDHVSPERLKVYLEKGRAFSILVELSLVERNSLNELLPACNKEDVAGIAFSVTGRGLLSGHFREVEQFSPDDFRRSDPLFQRERFQSGLRITEKVREIGRKYGKSPVQAAIGWALHQPGIISALTGPSSIKHLEENLGGSGWRFEREDILEMEQFLVQEQTKLEEDQRVSLKNILTGELAMEPHQAFTDLVYVLETAFCLGMASESELLPLFYELIPLREQMENRTTREKMIPIQAQMREKLYGEGLGLNG
jgi:aryl-alcohol dehydrogenase-like predicted oxidoreductase